MKTPRLSCHRFQIGQLTVPSFDVSAGEIVKLVFRREDAAAMDDVVRMLCRSGPHTTVHGPGTVAPVELPMPPSFLREMFHRQTAAEFLTARAGMNREQAESELRRVGVNPDAPICTLAGNPRWLIGFIAAKAARPAAIVFRSTGLDPLGLQTALATAAEQLGDSAGVYLTCFPDLGIQEPAYSAVLQVMSRNVPEPLTTDN
jgi:hypothetical protein